MKRIRIFFLIVFTFQSCLSHIAGRLGEGTGTIVDEFHTPQQRLRRICDYSDPSFSVPAEYPRAFRYGKSSGYYGMYFDLGAGIYIISNGGLAILGGLFYLIASPFMWGKFDSELSASYRRKPDINLSDGWLSNHTSECENVSDFFLYSTFRDRNDPTQCEVFTQIQKGIFHQILLEKSELPKSSIEKVKLIVGDPVLVPIQEEKDRCTVNFIIKYPGGKESLRKTILKEVN
ncbi:hypothetical protein [Leptospira jelokensis]|uniref:hypothetical protein n=1 Tax=Leptospira jelokensis TaxID=2484931 RepID=UPI0010913806|nr:hypothetical protein [Leptospira jelokensis]TGM02346.1 hypothetical protein EHQ79_13315 [Leptospira jelokensis]